MDNKQSIFDLVYLCKEKGIKRIVFSPGSRNAPLIIAFVESNEFETFSIPDERVAAFFALGMAQQSKECVAIISTSGSATLNYSPAIAEAYYQRIPLLVLTADRPPEWIDQGNGQTMRQRDLYVNYIKKSYEIIHESQHSDELWYNARIFNEAINECLIEPKGPVHINIPLREPLYNITNTKPSTNKVKVIEQISPPPELSQAVLDKLGKEWNKHSRKLILCGITPKSQELNDLIVLLAQDPSVVVLTETTSNLNHPKFIEQIDRVLFTIQENEASDFAPDLLLTFGTNIVSKKIKTLFRKWSIQEHWHIDETDIIIDTYKALTKHLRSDLVHFFTELIKRQRHESSDYNSLWQKKNIHCRERHNDYIKEAEWSDLLAYEKCLKALPGETCLQMANSTAVRYVQLLERRKDLSYFSNRGVAGIDGCSSTAAGASWVHSKLTVLVTGDLAFLYDSNILWIQYLSSKLRIIIFNNQGGNIFRFIPGPDSTNQLENYFEAHHQFDVKEMVRGFGLNYYSAKDPTDLESKLPSFLEMQDNEKSAIMEIFTPRKMNDIILKDYFKFLL